MTIEDLFIKGGPVVWILAAYSSLGLGIVLERCIYFMRLGWLPNNLKQHVDGLLEAHDAEARLSGLKGPELTIARAMLESHRDGVKDLARVGERVRSDELRRLELGLPTLGILANSAPLLGLFGTITGMIKAFMVIEQAGGKVDAQALAGGIWEAMITTGVGLAVAIPLVILLHFLESMVERRNNLMQDCVSLILERHDGGSAPISPAGQPHRWEEITDGI